MSFPSASAPGNPDDRACPACDSTSLTRGRLSTQGSFAGETRHAVDLFACDRCGDFWFERAGERLTAAAMRELGLDL